MQVLRLLGLVLLLQGTGELKGRIRFKTTDPERRIHLSGAGLGSSILSAPNEETLNRLPGGYGWINWDKTLGCTFHMKGIPDGYHLIYVQWRKKPHYMDWKWIDVPKEGTMGDIDFLLEPEVTGGLEVKVVGEQKETTVFFMPADDQGKVPSWKSSKSVESCQENTVKGTAIFKDLRPGKYVVYLVGPDASDPKPPPITSPVEVVAGKTAQLTLGN